MSTDSNLIQTLDQLRKIIPKPAPILAKRILPFLDQHCQNLIHHAALVVIGSFSSVRPTGSGMTLISLEDQKLEIRSEAIIDIIFDDETDFPMLQHAAPGSLYFILPGIGYGLRVNGRLTFVKGQDDSRLTVEVISVYLQCSRAKVRAGLWQDNYATVAQLTDPTEFIVRSSYLLMLTQNALGETELSPRGDPAGFVQVLDDGRLAIPERPGNKVAVSLRNILDTEKVSLLFFISGSLQLLSVTGRAKISCDTDMLAAMEINKKRPKLAVVVNIFEARIEEAAALYKSDVWESASHLHEKSLPSFAKIMGEHMGGKGIKGKLSSALVDVVVRKDLKNLY